jgi:hypothetical protein
MAALLYVSAHVCSDDTASSMIYHTHYRKMDDCNHVLVVCLEVHSEYTGKNTKKNNIIQDEE